MDLLASGFKIPKVLQDSSRPMDPDLVSGQARETGDYHRAVCSGGSRGLRSTVDKTKWNPPFWL